MPDPTVNRPVVRGWADEMMTAAENAARSTREMRDRIEDLNRHVESLRPSFEEIAPHLQQPPLRLPHRNGRHPGSYCGRLYSLAQCIVDERGEQ